jgi:hypothetical protein
VLLNRGGTAAAAYRQVTERATNACEFTSRVVEEPRWVCSANADADDDDEGSERGVRKWQKKRPSSVKRTESSA